MSQLRNDEKTMPLERQTAGVTKVGSKDTYIRQFAIDQGIDSVVTLLLHESFHGAGISMGPIMTYEPILHYFETSAGFPMMMGGADISDVEQKRTSDTDVDVSFHYNLRQIDSTPLPVAIEIQIVDQDSGEVVYQEAKGGKRYPVRERIPSKLGRGAWVWHAQNPGLGVKYAIRIVDMDSSTLMASRDFETNPRCVIGVSTMHCEDE